MTVGIIGAGQLGQMLALAGYPLGLQFLFLDPAEQTPGGKVAEQLPYPFTDTTALRRLAKRSEVVTFDWENIPVTALKPLHAAGCAIYPPIQALAVCQDRVSEKQLFEKLHIPTTQWQAVDSLRQLQTAITRIGLPGVLKTRRMGYDGKGQQVLRSGNDVESAWHSLGSQALIYENCVNFSDEVSIIGARSRRGEIAIYPLNRNLHAQGILRLTRAPFGTARLQKLAASYLRRVMQHFDYVGILTIEFFLVRGRLLANEMAPRVHNSGHWTIEGAQTSQFENHLRAILGLPLGATHLRGHSAMINFIGEMPNRAKWLAHKDVSWHDYGKEPRLGRKLGHCTVLAATAKERDRRARVLLRSVAPQLHFP
jgi:5-(carboxyamino)imidazole ribonucleotide synthase